MRAKLISEGIVGDDAYVVIAGPANTYAHYVATPEEYTVQRYEGASTIFGKCTCTCFPPAPSLQDRQFAHIGTLDSYIVCLLRVSP